MATGMEDYFSKKYIIIIKSQGVGERYFSVLVLASIQRIRVFSLLNKERLEDGLCSKSGF